MEAESFFFLDIFFNIVRMFYFTFDEIINILLNLCFKNKRIF